MNSAVPGTKRGSSGEETILYQKGKSQGMMKGEKKEKRKPSRMVDFWMRLLWYRRRPAAANGILMIMLLQHCTHSHTHTLKHAKDGGKSFGSYYNSWPQLDREPFCKKMTLYVMFQPFASAVERTKRHFLVTSSLTDWTSL